MMKTNRAGIELITAFEGCVLTAYPDPATKAEPYTIGYGHTSAAGQPHVSPGMRISKETADEILIHDLVTFEAALSKMLKRTPNENQFSAMASLVFNIGQGNFAKSSVLRLFNAGNAQGSADAFRMWNKGAGKVMKGLERRREAERLLFLRPVTVHAEPATPKPLPSPPDVPPVETLPPKAPPKEPMTIQRAMVYIVGGIIAAIVAWLGWGH